MQWQRTEALKKASSLHRIDLRKILIINNLGMKRAQTSAASYFYYAFQTALLFFDMEV
jgi:hypothetical protein